MCACVRACVRALKPGLNTEGSVNRRIRTERNASNYSHFPRTTVQFRFTCGLSVHVYGCFYTRIRHTLPQLNVLSNSFSSSSSSSSRTSPRSHQGHEIIRNSRGHIDQMQLIDPAIVRHGHEARSSIRHSHWA